MNNKFEYTEEFKNKYPSLFKITNEIISQNPFQKKRINDLFQRSNSNYFEYCEEIANLSLFVTSEWKTDIKYLASTYNKLCSDTIRDQLAFKRCGEYAAILNERKNE